MNKTKMPLISVIIPVYMVFEYLDRCIKSIINQQYSDLEIVLIDDGSHDDCSLKCDEWAQKDARIMVIHKLNGGLSDARNYGMQIISGEYVSFIDSDDHVSDDFIAVLLSTALEHTSDIVECSYTNFYESGRYEDYHDDLSERDYSTSDGLSALIEENPFHQHVWDKLYKRDVIQNIYFEVGKQHEDMFWTYQVFGKAKKATKKNCTMYFYLQRESSITGQGYTLRSLDYLEGKRNRQEYINNIFPELSLKAELDYFGSCLYLMQCALKYITGEEKQQAIRKIKDYKKMCHITFKDIKTVQGSSKKYFYLAKINIYLCGKLRADFNIGF